MIVTIDTDKVKVAVDEAGEFYFKPGAEKHLKLLVQYQAELAEAMAQAQANLQAAIDANNPAVTSSVGSHIKVTRSLTGSIYGAPDIEKVPAEFVKQAVRKFVDGKAVDKYLEEHDGKLPKGVALNNRNYRMAIKVIE
jgi:iron uptake system EfeUOB component EfeO/EfeM